MSFPKEPQLLLVIDHGSRAGNAFFMSVLDEHPEILCCPWVLYLYSYIVTEFGLVTRLSSKDAYAMVLRNRYFALLYNEVDVASEKTFSVIGADPGAKIDRAAFRRHFDSRVLREDTIERRELILAFFEALALATGRDLRQVKFVVLSDAISLRGESPLRHYSCRTIRAAYQDFPDFTLISLCRDPRAQLCSVRHQSINLNGNVYGARVGTFLRRFADLVTFNFSPDNFAFLFWLLYGRQTYLSIEGIRRALGRQCYDLRNEDLNLNFVPTMEKFVAHFGVSMNPRWRGTSYIPTMMGLPWRGTGAFIPSKYPAGTQFALAGESKEVISKSIGPNPHVTTRWRKQMNAAEIQVASWVLREELASHYADLEKARPSFVHFLVHLGGRTKGEGPRPGAPAAEKILYFLLWPLYWGLSRFVLLLSLLIMQGRQDYDLKTP